MFSVGVYGFQKVKIGSLCLDWLQFVWTGFSGSEWYSKGLGRFQWVCSFFIWSARVPVGAHWVQWVWTRLVSVGLDRLILVSVGMSGWVSVGVTGFQ